MFTLVSEKLKVELASPGELYRGSRFDWTGFVRQVTLADGTHTFCSVESPVAGQGSGGIGLCNEFGIMTPIGFAGTGPGDSFPKLGVGLLRRQDNETYSFFRNYRVDPFVTRCEVVSPGRVVIVAEPKPCRGFAARLRKEFAVDENRLTIGYCLENTGKQPLVTEEYAHNFVAIDGHGIGPGYALSASFPLSFPSLPEPLTQGADGSLGFARAPEKAFYGRIEQPGAGPGSWWRLEHKPSGVWMRETVDVSVAPFALWGVAHTMSPEAFVQIDLAPGQVMRWERRYEFGG